MVVTSILFGLKNVLKNFWLLACMGLLVTVGIQHKLLNDVKKENSGYVQTITSLESNLAIMQKAADAQKETVARATETKAKISSKIALIQSELQQKRFCLSQDSGNNEGASAPDNPVKADKVQSDGKIAKSKPLLSGIKKDFNEIKANSKPSEDNVLLRSLGRDVDRLLYDAETAAGASIEASSRISKAE